MMDMDVDPEDSFSELSSDEELQTDFAEGKLQPGLVGRAVAPRTYTNNVSGLREKLEFLKKRELEWLERMDITSTSPPAVSTSDEGKEELDPNDDFKREMHFYQQAQSSVLVGLRKLEEFGIETRRPKDYFAEMVKTDNHMRKVRESLLSRQKVLEQKEKARKLRELKKYGKKVQREILEKRRAEKKTAIDAVKKFRKGKGEKPSFLGQNDVDDFPVTTGVEDKPAKSKEKPGKGSKKRLGKNMKFGFGGKKRWAKSNTADSSADMSGFNSRKLSKTPAQRPGGKSTSKGKMKGRTKPKRLGKSRRQQMKH